MAQLSNLKYVADPDIATQAYDATGFALGRRRFSSWCGSHGKRAFDLLVALSTLLFALVPMGLVALLIKLTSRGPALFVHERVGTNGRRFSMYKFRTMEHATVRNGIALTRSGDERITWLGRYLRKWKIDELPQLINIVRGEMSIIGPRPHMERLLGNSPEQEIFLQLRPGVTGLATMLFRHEENHLPRLAGEELESYYIANILPQKIRLEVQYASIASFWTDLLIIMRTVQQIFAPVQTRDAAVLTSQMILTRESLGKHFRIPELAGFRVYVLWAALIFLACISFMWLVLRPASASSNQQLPQVSSWKHDASISVAKHFFRLWAIALPSHNSTLQDSSHVKVWVDLSTGLYYCSNAALYGRTKEGRYESQAQAQLEHLKPALHQGCGVLSKAESRGHSPALTP